MRAVTQVIGVVLIGGALFGIILDNLTEIREGKEENKENQANKCFICLEGKEAFEADGGSLGLFHPLSLISRDFCLAFGKCCQGCFS